jgi:cardiolipin synthase
MSVASPETYPPRVVRVGEHEIRVFAEAPELVSAMVEDIRSARSRVWVECYIFANDGAGQRIADALCERARNGLDVRVMYDAIGSQSTPAAFFQQMVDAGVDVHAYRTFWETLRRHSFLLLRMMNRRNHRKLVVIDDQVAYFGGMNIVDQSRARAGGHEMLPISGGWRDIHVRFSGPRQNEIAASIDRSWRRAVRRPLKGGWPRVDRNKTMRLEEGAILFIDSGFQSARRHAIRIFQQLIMGAEQRVLISMAYFLPPRRLMRALRLARKRGVRVDVVIPCESDVKLVQWATNHMLIRLLKMGIHVHERQARMLHSKVLVTDDRTVVIGSCNMDPRSLWTNLEFLAVIASQPLAATVTELCETEMEYSRKATIEAYRARRWWQRVRDRIAYAMRRWL